MLWRVLLVWWGAVLGTEVVAVEPRERAAHCNEEEGVRTPCGCDELQARLQLCKGMLGTASHLLARLAGF